MHVLQIHMKDVFVKNLTPNKQKTWLQRSSQYLFFIVFNLTYFSEKASTLSLNKPLYHFFI